MTKYRPVVLVVLDGWGYREAADHNAIAQANKPFFDSLWSKYPHALLDASGVSVGLPVGQMGNSEVGHQTIGAGRPVDTDIVRVDKAIASGQFQLNPAFEKLFAHVKQHSSVLHIQGLVSPGGVHSHQRHLFAFLKLAKNKGIRRVAIHAFTDGRDTSPQSAAEYLRELEDIIDDVGIGHIATVSGRFYAMDRDHNWDRLAKVEEAVFHGRGNRQARRASEVVKELYAQGAVDEHIEPIILLDETGQGYPISRGDGVFFFNFRADRARMMGQRVMERAKKENIFFVTLTEHDRGAADAVAFPPLAAAATLTAEIARAGMSQVHIAETEKYAHATYFLNVGREKPHPGEKDILVKSRSDVRTHDLAPAMRAGEITDRAIEELRRKPDFIFINYANPDMVGHTGNFEAAVQAIEAVDQELARLVPAVEQAGGAVFITADHGNAEIVYDADRASKHTTHTTNPVPAILTIPCTMRTPGALYDVAPTILELLGLPVPPVMSGRSLIV